MRNVSECGAVLQTSTRGKRSTLFGIFLALVAAASSAQGPVPPAASPAPKRGVEIVQSGGYPELHVDGKPFFVHSAAFFYFRIPRDMWEASLDRHRELGINTIDLVIPWNWHEPREAEFDFDGHTNPRRDLRSLLHLIFQKGFKLVVRPGPVIGADWRHAGYPDWLLERPEYGMSAEALRNGSYPPLAELAARDPEAAATAWMANATHMAYARKWLEAVGRELAPYSSKRTLPIEAPKEKGDAAPRQISGPLLFVILDGAWNTASAGAAYQQYIGALGQMLRGAGVDAALCINGGEGSGAIAEVAGFSGAVGEWFLRPISLPGMPAGSARSLHSVDLSILEGSLERLKAQTGLPPLVMAYQAGWKMPPDDARPVDSDPANTLLTSRLLIGLGAHGLSYFPLQDTLTPTGYGVPWVNRHYRWDAALDLAGSQRPRARPVDRNGLFIEAEGEFLAASHQRVDFGLVVTRASAGAGALNAIKVGRVAYLAGLSSEWLDPDRQPVANFLRHAVVVLPAIPEGGLSEKAQRVLVEYVGKGGVLAFVPPWPGGSILDELRKPGTEGPVPRVRKYGAGRVIEMEKDFYSWVELEESFSESGMRGEAPWAVHTLQGLMDQAGVRPVIRRDVNGSGTGEMFVTQLVSNSGSEPLGARSGGRGLLSVTNLSDEPGAETVEVLLPRASARGSGPDYIALTLQVPPHESLFLPLKDSLCTTAGPQDACHDEVLAAGAELLKAEREGKTLRLIFHTPAKAAILLRLDRQPERVTLDDFRPEAAWNPAENELSVSLPRGAWPHFLRILKIRMPYKPRVPERPKNPEPERRDFDFRVADSVRLPLGDDASLPSDPPLILVDAEKNGQMLVESTNYDELGRGVDFNVEGPVRGSDSLGLAGGDTRQVVVNLHAAPGAPPESATRANDGLLHGEIEVKSGRDRRRSPLAFVVVPKEGVVAYQFDFDRDGSKEWVLENSGIRLVVSPEDGCRALALVNKELRTNLLSGVGGMFEQFPDQDSGGTRLPAAAGLPCMAEWVTEGNQTALRLRFEQPGLKLVKTVRLKDATTVEVDEEVTAASGSPSVEVVYSFPAATGDDRGTQLCQIHAVSRDAKGASSLSAEPVCDLFIPGQSHELGVKGSPGPEASLAQGLEVRTPGRPRVAVEWDAGQGGIEMKNHSAMLRLRLPAAKGQAGVVQTTMRLRLLPSS